MNENEFNILYNCIFIINYITKVKSYINNINIHFHNNL